MEDFVSLSKMLDDDDVFYGEDALSFNYEDVYVGCKNYAVPFNYQFRKSLKFQNVIIIEGSVLEKAKRFSINLCFGKNGEDIAFHMNPRFDQNYLARNSLLDGVWGVEEGHSLRRMPLKRGEPFRMQIYFTKMDILVCVDGNHLFNYAQRVPHSLITSMEIVGDLVLSLVVLTSSTSYPVPEYNSKELIQSDTLSVPLTYILNDVQNKGMKFELTGRVRLLPHSFFINLQSGPQVYPHPLVVYHLSVRYSPEAYIVQNSWGATGSGWDSEERSPLPPSLAPGRSFRLIINITEKGILASFGVVKIPVFDFRLLPSLIKCLYVQGDVALSKISVS